MNESSAYMSDFNETYSVVNQTFNHTFHTVTSNITNDTFNTYQHVDVNTTKLVTNIFDDDGISLDLDKLNKTTEGSASTELIIFSSLLFMCIGVIGIGGNLLVICSVMFNKKMRTSMTNLLITNLAMADLFIMVFGIPEIIVVIRNSGYLYNLATCKANRYILVSALYGSSLTLVALSVERYIAIIHPIKAHILCNKRRLVVVLGCIWPVAWLAALPTVLFNTIQNGGPSVDVSYCVIHFPGDHRVAFITFKYLESIFFYFIPLTLQVTLYCCISRHLFMGTDRLYRRVHVRDVNGTSMERFSEALLARRGVVKMLILSVVVYFASYSPHQFLLIWNTASETTFHETWMYHVFTMVITNLNSAANPILYSIFSQNFRQCYKQFFCRCLSRKETGKTRHNYTSAYAPCSPRLWRHVSLATASTNV